MALSGYLYCMLIFKFYLAVPAQGVLSRSLPPPKLSTKEIRIHYKNLIIKIYGVIRMEENYKEN